MNPRHASFSQISRSLTLHLLPLLLAGAHAGHAAGEAPKKAVVPFDATQAKELQEAWAKHLGQPKELTTSVIDLKMALIPPGEFMMGSPESEAQRIGKYETQHKVRITKPFYMGVIEVSQAEFDTIMGGNPSYRGARMARSKQNFDVDTSRSPVERVSWFDTQEFCRRLSELPEEKAAGRVYRLPTEAEWEYACRAGTATPFYFGAMANGTQANFAGVVPYGTTERGPAIGRPSPSACYPPNPFGLYDMVGNVWEWTADWFTGDYNTEITDDPQGAEAGEQRAIRGGAWRSPTPECRSAGRFAYPPQVRAYDVGFRIVMTLSANAPKAAAAAPAPAKVAAAVEKKAAPEAEVSYPEKLTKGAAWKSPASGMEFVWIEALGIWVGKYEATNAEYRKMDPAYDSKTFLEKYSLNGDRQPVARMGFKDAKALADWSTTQDREKGALPEGFRYRLPTEEEWMAFARCGQDVKYPWGNEMPPTMGNYRGQEAQGRGDKIADFTDAFIASCNVEESGRNAWGLYGVAGNLWEACTEDATGIEAAAWHGGSFDTGPEGLLRTRFRSVGMPNPRYENYGFRLVLAPAVEPKPQAEEKAQD